MLSRHSRIRVNAWATWLALGVLVWQMLLSAGAIERPMAPVQFAGGALVICTEHGMQTLPGAGTLPAHPASDHSAPSCPCCMPFSAGNGFTLAQAPAVAAPGWTPALAAVIPFAAPPGLRLAADPQQPRAPPLSA